jgi:hypothetical protein
MSFLGGAVSLNGVLHGLFRVFVRGLAVGLTVGRCRTVRMGSHIVKFGGLKVPVVAADSASGGCFSHDVSL